MVACSGTEPDAATPSPDRSSSVGATATTASGAPATVAASNVTDGTAMVDTIATVPGGVPGLDSDDGFCRAWSEFAGTFQALALASDLAADPSTAFRSELAAAGAVTEAWQTMDSEFPEGIGASDRTAFLDGLIGPFRARATAAEQALLGAGLSPQQVDQLGALWLATLTTVGLGDPDIDVAVPDGMQTAFDSALAAWGADTSPIIEDDRLATTADAAVTQAYIVANCPDQGILAGAG